MNLTKSYRALMASVGVHLFIVFVFVLVDRLDRVYFSRLVQTTPGLTSIQLITLPNTLSVGSLSLNHSRNLSRKLQKKAKLTKKIPESPMGTNPDLAVASPAEEVKESAAQTSVDQNLPSAPFRGDLQVGGATPLQIYASEVTRKIDSLKIYPEESLFRSEEGRVVVLIQIFPDGTIKHFHLTESCPFEALNEATLNTISQLRSLPPLPQGRLKPLTMQVPVIYKLEKNKIS